MITTQEVRQSPSERKSGRRYQIEVIGAGIAYVVLVFASTASVDHVPGFAKYLVAVGPALGSAAMALAMVRYVMRMDELQRQTFVTAAAIALVVTVVFTSALGFLENAGLPQINLTSVWIVAVASWAIAMPFVRRRFS